ncbi:eukaryotic translation initiation factor 3 subunit b [Anaeramoeba flamelloides]|uniref:Eukaryotic translation initiation factor 3 subunit b n=1 Tax=Anaeramoeba flamelloides TaxID=1746091 RepID=A0AAV7Y262_9EUKA|nr:eukaryotic translation initiation factor 3 subunit b [Anaeramoeba flamelloides]
MILSISDHFNQSNVIFIFTQNQVQKLHFQWEPRGQRFDVITREERGSLLRIYRVNYNNKKTGKGISTKFSKLIASFELPKNADTIKWSPRGRLFLVLATRSNEITIFDAELEEKVNVSDSTFDEVYWDPTCRYFVTNTREKFTIWSFQGMKLSTETRRDLRSTSWRPRLPTRLTLKETKKINQNLEKTIQKYQTLDQKRVGRKHNSQDRERLEKIDKWNQYLKAKKLQRKKERELRHNIVGYYSDED